MKENIIYIIDRLISKPHLSNYKLSLSINTKNVLDGIFLKDIQISEISDILSNIETYNITIESEVKNNSLWVYNKIIFWNDNSKYGRFEWISEGSRNSFISNEITSELRSVKSINKYNDEYYTFDGNYFEYSNVDNVIDTIIELDILFDRHHKEKYEVIDKLKSQKNINIGRSYEG